MITVLLVILALMVLGVIPHWSWSHAWGYGPSGVLGLILVIVVIWAIVNRPRGPSGL